MSEPERIKIYLDLLKSKTIEIDGIKKIPIHFGKEFELDYIKFTSNTPVWNGSENIECEDIFEVLEKIWLKNPDWRFTQLCVNTGLIPNLPGFWYYTEDREFMSNLGFPIREILLWGSYGKNGDQPLKHILLKNMTNSHIESILKTQYQLKDENKKAFNDELKLREENPEFNIFEI